jgi:hypothetical protein
MVEGQLAVVGENTAAAGGLRNEPSVTQPQVCRQDSLRVSHSTMAPEWYSMLRSMRRRALTTSCIVHELRVCVEVDDYWLLSNSLHQQQRGNGMILFMSFHCPPPALKAHSETQVLHGCCVHRSQAYVFLAQTAVHVSR